jgi:hypothetical protein
MSQQPYTVSPDGNFIVRPSIHDCFYTPCGTQVVVLSIYSHGVVFDNQTSAKATELHQYTFIKGEILCPPLKRKK